jgi:outer membrane immunogenic protein
MPWKRGRWQETATATQGCRQFYSTAFDRVDDTFINFTGGISAGAEPPRRHGGECFGKAVVSFAPTSASGCTNEAFAANDADAAIGDRSREFVGERWIPMSLQARSVWRHIAVIASVLAMSSMAALATDLPPRMPVKAPPPASAVPVYSWSGLYVGGHLGYLWGRTRVEEDGVVIEDNARTNGVVGGMLAGYNWQIGVAVLGLEGDFGWSNAHGVGTLPPIPVTTRDPNRYDLRWTSHARGRIGYAFQNALVFAAGGLAVADLNFTEGAITTIFVPAQSSGGKYFGWSLGGGVEWGMTPNLVSRIEYFYDNYGHKDYIGVLGDPYRVSLKGQTLRGALAWKFNP